jgi:hypothetical protein
MLYRSLRHHCLLAIAIVLSASVAMAGVVPSPNPHCIDSRKYLRFTPGIGAERGKGIDPGATLLGPPGGPHSIGDSWNWYIWHLNGMPWYELKPCTIRGISDHAYMVVENSVWGTQVDQNDVDTVLQHFEDINFTPTPLSGGIYDQAVEAFGNPPLGLDSDPRIYLLYYDLDISADGFFWIFDADPDGTNPMFRSNECEVLYLNCGPDAGVNHDPSGNYMIGIIAHEFQHLIHYGYDRSEESWLNESLSEYAMFRYGADDPSWIASFLGNPDVELIPGPTSNIHYGACWFFGVYLAGHYGGPAFTNALVANQAVGINAINDTLGTFGYARQFSDVYRDWVVANLVDDPSIASGEFGYPDYDFAPIAYSAAHMSFPVGVTSGSVNRWAADYVRFEGYSAIQILFNGRDTDDFALRFVEIDRDGALSPRVSTIAPDVQQNGAINLTSTSGYEITVMVPGAMEPGGTPSIYTYSTDNFVAPLVLYAVKPAANPATDVMLLWTGGDPPFDLYRSLDASTLRDLANRVLQGVTSPHTVTGEIDPLIFYSIEPGS